LEDIIACGCERVLTSGQKAAAPDAGVLLGKLVSAAGGRISIMPGAGVRSSNIGKLMQESGATEFHSSARKIVPNEMTFANPQISDFGNVYLADENELKAMISVLG
jgi:copper homeostasis protein